MFMQDSTTVTAAGNAARRFQLMARLHLDRPNFSALRRDGQLVFDLLWRMGFRPGGRPPIT